MLNLTGLVVEGMKETEDEYTISVTVKEEPPKDWGAFMRRAFPVRERPVIGYRLSTLAKLAGKMPLN